MAIYIRTWPGSGTALVIDMTNAGKRGKTCRALRVSGVSWDEWQVKDNPVQLAAVNYTRFLMANFGKTGILPDGRFDVCRDAVREVIDRARTAGVEEGLLAVYDHEVRGVDAPKEPLRAGVEGLWSAGADETGVTLRALNDPNEWTEATHGQSPARAYDLARRVWDKVRAAATRHEASKILEAAGCKLHGWCACD